MRQTITNKILPAVMLLSVAALQIGCAESIFRTNGSTGKAAATNIPTTNVPTTPTVVQTPTPDLTFINDSFERNDIFQDLTNNIIYGWRGLIFDALTPVLGFTSPGALVTIPQAGVYGPAYDGNRFLLISGGSNDNNAEKAYVVSQTYDLSQFNTVILSYRYLTFGLHAGAALGQGLKLEVCKGTVAECGISGSGLDSVAQQTANWVTLTDSATDGVVDAAMNGHNQLQTDWRTGAAIIDLNDPAFVGTSSTFTFRFVASLQNKLVASTGGTGSGGTGTGGGTICKDDDDKDHDGKFEKDDRDDDDKDRDDKDREDKDDDKDNSSDHQSSYFHTYCAKHKTYHHHDCNHKHSDKDDDKDGEHHGHKHHGDKDDGDKDHGDKDHKCMPNPSPTPTPNPNPGSNGGNIIDGAAIDFVHGIATQILKSQLG